jgi:hypothetical protein
MSVKMWSCLDPERWHPFLSSDGTPRSALGWLIGTRCNRFLRPLTVACTAHRHRAPNARHDGGDEAAKGTWSRVANAAEEKKQVLLVAGSGYLGQHLLAELASACHDLDGACNQNREPLLQPILSTLPSYISH